MKIKISKSLREPLTLRWNEIFSAEESKQRVYRVREALHSVCEAAIKAGAIQQTPIGMLIGFLQSVAETAGGDDVWIEYHRHTLNDGTRMIRYTIGFVVPGSPGGHCWKRSIPVE